MAVARPRRPLPNQQAAGAADVPGAPLCGSAALRAGGSSKCTPAKLPPGIAIVLLVTAVFALASALEFAGGNTFKGTLHAMTAAQIGAMALAMLTAKALFAVASWFERRPSVPLGGSATTRAGGSSKRPPAKLPPVIAGCLLLMSVMFGLASALEYAGGNTFLGTCHGATALGIGFMTLILIMRMALAAVASWFERR